MILDFSNQTTKDIFNGDNTKEARKIPKILWKIIHRKFDMLNAAQNINDLMVPPGNRLEKLKGNFSEFHSIRVNDQFRIIFKWQAGNATHVKVTDYH